MSEDYIRIIMRIELWDDEEDKCPCCCADDWRDDGSRIHGRGCEIGDVIALLMPAIIEKERKT